MTKAGRNWKVIEGYARPISLALGRPSFVGAALRLVVEAIRSFFGPQFENALFRRRPLVNVDHPLDLTVPFDPSYVKKYLEFIVLWMSSFYRLGTAYGSEAYPLLVRYVGSIRRLYAEAGAVYKTVHTTTTRPAENYNLRFAIIHATDPHQNCVPSLHILIVVANWKLAASVAARMRERGKLLGPAGERRLDDWIEALRDEALAISESVLFVKQHSVNCIGASLFYLRRRGPRLSEEEIYDFVRDVFDPQSAARLGKPAAEALRARMLRVYHELDASYVAHPERGWKGPILEFIEGYAQLSGRSVSSMAESSSGVRSV